MLVVATVRGGALTGVATSPPAPGLGAAGRPAPDGSLAVALCIGGEIVERARGPSIRCRAAWR